MGIVPQLSYLKPKQGWSLKKIVFCAHVPYGRMNDLFLTDNDFTTQFLMPTQLQLLDEEG